MEVSNPYLRPGLKWYCKEEGLGLDSSFEYLESDKRTRVNKLGSKEAKKAFGVEKKNRSSKCSQGPEKRYQRS